MRKAAELVKRFDAADRDTRHRMIAAEPSATGDVHWDALLAALAEWLAVRTGLPAPEWVHRESRYVHGGWWVTPMRSMRAWEYAGSPASFQNHGVCLHRDAPSPHNLLATKLLASRVSRDEDDILLLYKLCGFTTVEQGLDLLETYYPGRPVEAKVRFYLEELLG